MVGFILSSSLWKETAKEEKTWKVHLAVETILILYSDRPTVNKNERFM